MILMVCEKDDMSQSEEFERMGHIYHNFYLKTHIEYIQENPGSSLVPSKAGIMSPKKRYTVLCKYVFTHECC